MNKSIVIHYLSKSMLIGSVMFLIPALITFGYCEWYCTIVFLIVGFSVAVISLPMAIRKPKNKNMFAREGMVIAASLWILFSLAGALPFYFSGAIPDFCDAFFESVSGFTTTGSTILSDIESLPRGILFWRSFTHWIGGMGVLVLAIAILPSSENAMHLMRAECPGPQVSKLVPKGKNSAAYLYLIYTAMTLITFVLLIAGGMPVFDSICHAMGAAGTGGFGIKNQGIGYYNSVYIEAVLIVAMVLCGVNFSLYYLILVKRFHEVRRNTEVKVYLAILVIASLLIMLNIMPLYNNSLSESFRYSVFQVSSIMTSTGYATADYNDSPVFSQSILILLMYIGACAGSTGGGFKVQRVVIMFKSSKQAIRKMLYPNSVSIVKSDDRILNYESVYSVMQYFAVYTGILIVSLLLISLNNADFGTTFTAVVTCVNNMGPGINQIGPMDNFSFFSDFSKYVLAFDMLLGRLECLPFFVLFAPSVWKKNF